MGMFDWSQCPVIESDPEKHHGDWVFKGTRLPVSIIFACLADGATLDDLVDWYGVNPEQVKEVLSFIAARLQEAPIHANTV